ncbi:hypothetical protein [Kitasatospora sp. NPDC001175]|uniref:hypothetical protein n=1 Tax=Kitasatospora sp. NPDC001175 TaxID=3157103 RepID=UPI003D010ED8
MTDLRRPTAGGCIRISPTGRGDYTVKALPLEDPLEGATDGERAFYLANYQGVPLAELLRRLRLAEWNAAEYRQRVEQLEEQSRRMPSLALIHEMDARHRRVRALLDRPGRVSRAELLAALSTPTTDES